MSLYDDVDREALHDWLDHRPELLADTRPDPSEYEDDERDCPACGGSGLRADELGDVTAAEREMLDSARCHSCGGRETQA